ncbi:MAG: hypothetical protein AAFN74_09805 [Myxococcota bacterium]
MTQDKSYGSPSLREIVAQNLSYTMFKVDRTEVTAIDGPKVTVRFWIGGEWHEGFEWRNPNYTYVNPPEEWGDRPTFKKIPEETIDGVLRPVKGASGHILIEARRAPEINGRGKWPADLASDTTKLEVTSYGWLLWAEFKDWPGFRLPLVPTRHFRAEKIDELGRPRASESALEDQGPVPGGHLHVTRQLLQDYSLDVSDGRLELPDRAVIRRIARAVGMLIGEVRPDRPMRRMPTKDELKLAYKFLDACVDGDEQALARISDQAMKTSSHQGSGALPAVFPEDDDEFVA